MIIGPGPHDILCAIFFFKYLIFNALSVLLYARILYRYTFRYNLPWRKICFLSQARSVRSYKFHRSLFASLPVSFFITRTLKRYKSSACVNYDILGEKEEEEKKKGKKVTERETFPPKRKIFCERKTQNPSAAWCCANEWIRGGGPVV